MWKRKRKRLKNNRFHIPVGNPKKTRLRLFLFLTSAVKLNKIFRKTYFRINSCIYKVKIPHVVAKHSVNGNKIEYNMFGSVNSDCSLTYIIRINV